MKKTSKEYMIKNIQKSIFSNYKIKITCFILAIIMYIAVGLLQRNIKTYTCELKIINLKDYFVIKNEIPQTIKIIANDKEDVFAKITDQDFNVRIDLNNINQPNKYVVKVEWDVPETMNSFFSTIKAQPKKIEIEIDKLAEKNVEIIPNYIGEPAKGYFPKRTVIEPSHVRIQGPESLVSKINSVKTETINIEGIKESFRRNVTLISDVPTVKVLGKADIYFEIVEETDQLTYTFKKAVFLNLKNQFKAHLNEDISITFTGPKKDMSTITQDNFIIYIDCAKFVFPGEYTAELEITRPDNFNILSILPPRPKITIEDK